MCRGNRHWNAYCVRAKVRTWLPDRSLISVRSYWGQIWRIWDLTHLDEHCGKEGSSTRKNTCENHAEGPFGIVSDQPSILLAKSQGRSQYVVHFRDDGACPKNETCSFSGELTPHCTAQCLQNHLTTPGRFPHVSTCDRSAGTQNHASADQKTG